MWRKKEYKRSDWYQGLLDAEQLHKHEGFGLVATGHELRGCTEYENGVFDYIEHARKLND